MRALSSAVREPGVIVVERARAHGRARPDHAGQRRRELLVRLRWKECRADRRAGPERATLGDVAVVV